MSWAESELNSEEIKSVALCNRIVSYAAPVKQKMRDFGMLMRLVVPIFRDRN